MLVSHAPRGLLRIRFPALVLRRLPGTVLLIIAALFLALVARPAAAQYTWIGGGGNGLWSTALNWTTTGGASAAPPTSGAAIVFGLGSTQLSGSTANRTATAFTFTTVAGPFVINPANVATGNTLVLTGSMSNQSSNIQTFNVAVSVGGTQRLDTGNNGVGSIVFNRAVQGGSFDVTGSGRAVFNSANTYTGGMTVGGGATVTGTGRLPAVNVLAGGVLTPGGTASQSYGTLTLGTGSTSSGSFIVSGGTAATVALGISGTTRGTNYDSFLINGTGNQYGGVLAVSFDNATLYDTFTSFDLFQLAHATPTGNFSSIRVTGGSYDGLTFSGPVNGVWTSTQNSAGQFLSFSQITGDLVVVPEPSTIVVACVGSAMTGWSLWRQRRAKRRLSRAQVREQEDYPTV